MHSGILLYFISLSFNWCSQATRFIMFFYCILGFYLTSWSCLSTIALNAIHSLCSTLSCHWLLFSLSFCLCCCTAFIFVHTLALGYFTLLYLLKLCEWGVWQLKFLFTSNIIIVLVCNKLACESVCTKCLIFLVSLNICTHQLHVAQANFENSTLRLFLANVS